MNTVQSGLRSIYVGLVVKMFPWILSSCNPDLQTLPPH